MEDRRQPAEGRVGHEGTAVKTVRRRMSSYRYWLVLEGIGVGAAAGLVAVLFRLALGSADTFRTAAIAWAAKHAWSMALWIGVLVAAAAAVTLFLRWEPLISGSGIPQVEGEMLGQVHQTWWRVLLAKFGGGVVAIASGLALGREGPSIQLGAMAGKGVSRLCGRVRTEEKLLMTCGASAGLSAAFGAPFAGVLFALEEVHKNFSLDVLLPAMASSITADFISSNIFGLKPVFDLSVGEMMPLRHYWLLIALGLVIGLLGVLYNRCVGLAQDLYARIPSRFLRTLIPFLLAGALAFTLPQLLGSGHGLVEEMSSFALPAVLALFAGKFLFSMASFGAGVPGGIFLPLLVLGSFIGSGFFLAAAPLVGLPKTLLLNFVVLGMAGYFSAIVRAPVTGIVLICEMTGSFTHLLSLSLVSLVAYAVADSLHCKPVYDQLLERLLTGLPAGQKPQPASEEKVLVDAPVCLGARACGKTISQIDWPDGCLVVSIVRHEQELIPRGDTAVQAGDQLTVLCGDSEVAQVRRAMEHWCETALRRRK